MDDACVFCKIVNGKIPTDFEYQDEDMSVFKDKFPSAPRHLLFVSKTHGEEFHNVDIAKLSRILAKVREKALEWAVPYRIVINGAGATMVHNHLHVHLMGEVASSHKL